MKERQKLMIRLLDRLNRQTVETDTIREILVLMKKYTGFEAVGIRLHDGEDYPYYVTNGFPDDFVEAERYLCTRDKSGRRICDAAGNPQLECMCGNIIRGRVDPSQPFFTEGGSFWTNCTTELLATTTEKDRQSRTRNRCNGEGYESVALIPLRSKSQVIGLLQLNDRRKNLFTPDIIPFYEGVGASIGVALGRIKAEEEIRKSQKMLAEAERLGHIGSWEWAFATDKITLSDELYHIFGLEKADRSKEIAELFLACVDPQDSDAVRQALKEARVNNRDVDIEYSINRPNGDKRYVRTRAKVTLNGRGLPARMIGLTQDITEQKLFEEALHRAQAELAKRVEERTSQLAKSNLELTKKQDALEKKNVALGEVLDHISDEKESLKRQIAVNIEESIIPTILRLKNLSDPANARFYEILERDLHEISSPFLDTLKAKYHKLSPREVEVCRLIKHGYTSKEIAQTLHSSEQTVIKQRKIIRKKLGISQKDINLASFLESTEYE